ncbi:MAG: hypothetical protein N2440_02040 [Actinobacteria bacterium]|nr:hypothetical protein [Actinomycetota bacterium]
MKVIILGVDEESKILASFLREKEVYAQVVMNISDFKNTIKNNNYDACVLDSGFSFEGNKSSEETILKLKESYGIPRVYCMSYLDADDYDLPLHEDGHLYKPLTKRDLEIFYRVLLKDEKKELVCLFFGLRFYASPERAKILKARVEDFLLKNFESEGLVGIDVHYPPVDLTPTISTLFKKRNIKQIKDEKD